MSSAMLNHNKLSKTLQLLSKAANEKKEAIEEGFNHVKEMTSEAIEENAEKIKKTATKVNRSVYKNPWAFIGGVAAGSLIVGYALGWLKKK